MRRSASARVSRSSALPVPLNSSKITSSMRLSVSTSAVATTVREPPSGTARAAPNSPSGLASALASRPPDMVRPLDPLAEAERAHQVHHALDLGGARARRPGGLEQEWSRGVDGAELRELGAVREPRTRRRAIHAHHATVLERDEVAAPQSGKPDRGVALGGEVAARGEADEAALWRGFAPAGDRSQVP